MSEIGVLAVDNADICHSILVRLDGCQLLIDGAVQTARYDDNGIRVRRIGLNKIRISVPNCDNVKLIMSVTCQSVRGEDMLRFDISRGLNLRPSSHGLLGEDAGHVYLRVAMYVYNSNLYSYFSYAI